MTDTEDLARGYTLVNETQYNAGLYLLDRLRLRTGEHVLDVGCGPGNLTTRIADLVGEEGVVVGIDPSKERIAIALHHNSVPERATQSNLSFFEGRAEDLSRFASSSFDVVYVNSTFHWVQDQESALREFSRVLRPGGRLGISGGSGDFVAAHERIKADVLSREPYRNYPEEAGPKFLKRKELEGLLDRAGFSEKEFVINTIVKSARDGAEMIEWLDTSSSGKTYGAIPLHLRPRAREEMKLEWDKITTGDGIKMQMELLVTVAIK